MTKYLQADSLIMLYNKLASLSMRSPQRKLIIKEASELYGVSKATIYRSLRRYNKLSTVMRMDYNRPRLIKYEEMKKYCELIAALKLRTTNKNGRHLSNAACIRILEEHGIETNDGLVKAPAKLLKNSPYAKTIFRKFCSSSIAA